MFLIAIILVFAVNAQSIMLRSNNGGISKSSDRFAGFEATFSYNQIEGITITGSERGVFSTLAIAGAYPSGEFGTPELPVFKRMIAVPVGATPKIVVRNFTATEYHLEEYGIHTIFPRQPDVRKDQDVNSLPFIYDERAYARDDYNHSEVAEVSIIGTMRGIIIGMVVIHPVQYNPATHSIMVYNDIEIEVVFEGGNYRKTEDMLVNTFSPHFKNVYETFFNTGVTKDIFNDRPDLYSTPVHMLVIAHRMFEETLQPWIEWKTKKGFYMDVNYTDVIGTTAAQIKAFCHSKYNQGITDGTAPTFIIIVGDTPQVPASQIGSSTSKATDLYYATIDAGYFPSMYYSRMSAQTTQQLANIIEKTLYYEQYQFKEPEYLDNVLLIAGVDATWAPRVGRPQINYAADNYFNAAHGYVNVHKYVTSVYTGCYEHLNNVGFANYTAHCMETVWDDPRLTISNVNALNNLNKYYVAMGNCCLAADFGYGECIGEAMIRAEKKGAVGYIGSSPNSYWGDDFHFTVGAYAGSIQTVTNPTLANTKTGCYDFMFRDADFNTLCSYVFGGNLAVTYAHTHSGYTVHTSSPRYYWEAYNVLGDGSLMPYLSQGSVNTVSHLPTVPIGISIYEVTAAPGSYIAISKNGILHGVAVADASGTAIVTLNPPIYEGGDVDIVVTRNQYQPYITQVPAVAMDGAYVVQGGYTIVGAETLTYISTNTEVAVTLKNVGVANAYGPLNITFTCNDPQLTIINGTTHTGSIAADGTAIVNLRVTVANDIPDNKIFPVVVTVTGSNGTWESRLSLRASAPKFSLERILINGVDNNNLEPGTVTTITAIVKNTGGAGAYNVIGNIITNSQYITPACDNINPMPQSLPAGETIELPFVVTVSPTMPVGHIADLSLALSAQYGLSFVAPFTTSNSGGGYCTPGSTDCSSNDRFTSVILVKTSDQSVVLTNTNGTCTPGGYENFTHMTIPLTPGEQYTIRVRVNYGSNTVRGWMDLNGNKTFDSNEQLISISANNAGQEYSQTFTIPQDAVPGVHRFRLRTRYYGTPDACGTWQYGQTHDYTIVVAETHPRVQNVNATLSNESITITWDAPNSQTPVGYNIYRDENRLNTTPLANTNFTETNIVEGVYVYSVTAVFSGNRESVPQMSNVICNFTLPTLCEEPINLTAIADDSNCQAIVSWEEPEKDGLLMYYTIYRNGNKVAETPSSVLEYVDAGLVTGTYIYRVSATYAHCGETDLTDGVEITITGCLGINNVQTASFEMFPNPANNEVTIKGAELSRVELFDLQGRKLAGYTNIKGNLQINVSNYDNGVYFVRMYSKHNQVVTKKLVIAK